MTSDSRVENTSSSPFFSLTLKMNPQSGNPVWVSLHISFLWKNHPYFQLSNPVAAKVLMLLNYRHEKLVTEANCLAVLPFSNVIPLKEHLIFSSSPFFKEQINMENLCTVAHCCFMGEELKISKYRDSVWGHYLTPLWTDLHRFWLRKARLWTFTSALLGSSNELRVSTGMCCD